MFAYTLSFDCAAYCGLRLVRIVRDEAVTGCLVAPIRRALDLMHLLTLLSGTDNLLNQ